MPKMGSQTKNVFFCIPWDFVTRKYFIKKTFIFAREKMLLECEKDFRIFPEIIIRPNMSKRKEKHFSLTVPFNKTR